MDYDAEDHELLTPKEEQTVIDLEVRLLKVNSY